jgi:hypothetical protein
MFYPLRRFLLIGNWKCARCEIWATDFFPFLLLRETQLSKTGNFISLGVDILKMRLRALVMSLSWKDKVTAICRDPVSFLSQNISAFPTFFASNILQQSGCRAVVENYRLGLN